MFLIDTIKNTSWGSLVVERSTREDCQKLPRTRVRGSNHASVSYLDLFLGWTVNRSIQPGSVMSGGQVRKDGGDKMWTKASKVADAQTLQLETEEDHLKKS